MPTDRRIPARPLSSPSPSAKSGLWRRHRALIIVFSVIILIAAGVQGYHVYQVRAIKADQARFARAAQDIDQLSAQIITATGQPLKVDKSKSCSRPHLKYQKGPLSCDVSVTHFYGVNDEVQATELYMKVSSVVSNSWSNVDEPTSDTQAFSKIIVENYNPKNDYQQINEHYLGANKDIKCNTVYDFYKANAPPFSDYYTTKNERLVLGVDINCSDSAKAEHYPLNS